MFDDTDIKIIGIGALTLVLALAVALAYQYGIERLEVEKLKIEQGVYCE